jgi:hypothetical protein
VNSKPFCIAKGMLLAVTSKSQKRQLSLFFLGSR